MAGIPLPMHMIGLCISLPNRPALRTYVLTASRFYRITFGLPSSRFPQYAAGSILRICKWLAEMMAINLERHRTAFVWSGGQRDANQRGLWTNESYAFGG
jgi:hypothetical protein